MSLKDSFENAVKSANFLNERPSNEDLLRIYALYKQATVGDNNEDAPGGLDFKAAAKHNAWKKLEGMSSDEAMTQYIDLIEGLKSA